MGGFNPALLRSCLQSLAVLLLIYGVTAGAYFVVLKSVSDDPDNGGYAAIFALFAVFLIVMTHTRFAQNREEKAIRQFLNRQPYEDGQYAAASGAILPAKEPLVSPLQKRECVTYQFGIYKEESWDDGETIRKHDFVGSARTAAFIRTEMGNIKLYGVYSIDQFEETYLRYDEVRRNAAEYIAGTTFSPLKEGIFSVLPDVNKLIGGTEEEMKLDSKRSSAALSPEHLFQEKCVESGESVCALGVYSAAHHGLVPDPSQLALVTLIPGTAEQALQSYASRRKLGFLVAFALWAASILVLFFMVLNEHRI